MYRNEDSDIAIRKSEQSKRLTWPQIIVTGCVFAFLAGMSLVTMP